MTKPDLSALYRDTQARLAALIAGLDAAALATQVPACPGWSVQDVLAHLFAISEDALAGRLAGPPDEEQTAAQVARFRRASAGDMLAGWARTTPQFSEVVGKFIIWPAVIDVASHEQDIRSALGRPGARDSEVVRACAGAVLSALAPPVPVRISVEDAEFRVGPGEPGAREPGPGEPGPGEPDQGAGLRLATTRFEALRWRMGRRSRAQMAAMDWSGDPAAVLDHLAVFGPAAGNIAE